MIYIYFKANFHTFVIFFNISIDDNNISEIFVKLDRQYFHHLFHEDMNGGSSFVGFAEIFMSDRVDLQILWVWVYVFR